MMRTMIQVTDGEKTWYLYDVGADEIGMLVDKYGNTAICVLEWGQCNSSAEGHRAEERVKILKHLGIVPDQKV